MNYIKMNIYVRGQNGFRPLILVLALLGMISGCSIIDPEDSLTFHISGQVVATPDGVPLPEATVTLEKGESCGILSLCEALPVKSTSTGSAGNYELTYTNSGFCGELLFSLRVGAPGYKTKLIWGFNIESEDQDVTYTGNNGNFVRCQSRQTINVELEPLAP